jgi:glycosyltransferase involved in cell wall biosynthesis
VTPTKASKADLTIAGYSEARVYVASPPADEFSDVRERPTPGIDQRFILFVGTLEPRKNVDLLLEAWDQRPTDDALLVMVGRRAWGAPTLSQDVLELGAVSDAELLWLYRHASALVSPSHYEGFGLPIVEALAQGAFVIATDIPASREVAGDGAVYCHPEDTVGLSALMSDALRKHGHRIDTRWEPAGERSKYTLQRFGDELAAAYRSIGRATGL